VRNQYQHIVRYNRQKPDDAMLQDLMHKAGGVNAEMHPGQTLPQSSVLYAVAKTYACGINKNKETVDKMLAGDTIEMDSTTSQMEPFNAEILGPLSTSSNSRSQSKSICLKHRSK
jgi:hypothetical protein